MHHIALAIAFMLSTAAGSATAMEPPSAQEPSACIDVEVNGQRIPSYECLSSRLAPVARDADRHATAPLASERVATRPSNEIGLFNQAATQQRMGNTFGTSVEAQRPPTPPPVSPIVTRP